VISPARAGNINSPESSMKIPNMTRITVPRVRSDGLSSTGAISLFGVFCEMGELLYVHLLYE
jgi:hypothetical protein